MSELILLIALLLNARGSLQRDDGLPIDAYACVEDNNPRILFLKSNDAIMVATDEQCIPTNIFSSISSISSAFHSNMAVNYTFFRDFLLIPLKFHDYLFWRVYRSGIFAFLQKFSSCAIVIVFILVLLPILYAKYKSEYEKNAISEPSDPHAKYSFTRIFKPLLGPLEYPVFSLPSNFDISKIEIYPFPLANSVLKVLCNSFYPLLLLWIFTFIHGILIVHVMSIFPLDSHTQMQYAASVIYSKSITFPNMIARVVINSALELFMLQIECSSDPSMASYVLSIVWCGMWYFFKSLLSELLLDLKDSNALFLLVCAMMLLSITTSIVKSSRYMPAFFKYMTSTSSFDILNGVLLFLIGLLLLAYCGVFEANSSTNFEYFSHKYILRAIARLYYFISREFKISVSKFITIDFMKIMARMNLPSGITHPILALEHFYAGSGRFLSEFLQE
ncbi:hypothetical protein MDAP_000188 [Mitosporidium daphniae]